MGWGGGLLAGGSRENQRLTQPYPERKIKSAEESEQVTASFYRHQLAGCELLTVVTAAVTCILPHVAPTNFYSWFLFWGLGVVT